MAFVPGYQYDIFFSYATVDDEPQVPGEKSTKRISIFRLMLLTAVSKKLGRAKLVADFFDRKDLTTNADSKRRIADAIKSSAVYLCFASPAFVHPECFCVQECQWIREQLGDSDEERLAQERVWVLSIDKVNRDQWQSLLFPQLNERKLYLAEDGKVRRLPRREDKQDLIDIVNDLADEIAGKLKAMKTAGQTGAAIGNEADPTGSAEQPRKKVLLAMVKTAALQQERKALQQYLEKEEGYKVIPTADYGKDIGECCAFVQLLDESPWEPGNVDAVQHRLATEHELPIFPKTVSGYRHQQGET